MPKREVSVRRKGDCDFFSFHVMWLSERELCVVTNYGMHDLPDKDEFIVLIEKMKRIRLRIDYDVNEETTPRIRKTNVEIEGPAKLLNLEENDFELSLVTTNNIYVVPPKTWVCMNTVFILRIDESSKEDGVK